MRILFIGSVTFSARALNELIAIGANVVGICTLRSSSFNADFQDLTPIAQNHLIPVLYAENLNCPDAINWIANLSPDVIFCFGWSRLIREPLLSMPPLGVVGFHPSALPANRGRHPIIWALVLGLHQTASTYFLMDKGADSGDILSQRSVDIYQSDNAASLYDRISHVAIEQLRELVPRLADGSYQLTPQTNAPTNSWRKRSMPDGCIDWRMAASTINNLVRGLSRPYVGAHFLCNNEIIKVWKTETVMQTPPNLEPGKVLEVTDNSIVVKAGIDAIRLLEYSPNPLIQAGTYL